MSEHAVAQVRKDRHTTEVFVDILVVTVPQCHALMIVICVYVSRGLYS
jgi:hypothetical protein